MQQSKKHSYPLLYIFSGLPGSGKTTLSRLLAVRTGGVHLRIDTIEQGLRDLCHVKVESEGYYMAYKIAADNLSLGIPVIADSCNPLNLTRRKWEEFAASSGCEFINIEVVCSDSDEHRRRIESRTSDIENLKLPTWDDVLNREYHTWPADSKRIVVNTARQTPQECLDQIPAFHLP